MELTWFGHANFRLKSSGATFLIDPFFEGNPTAPMPWREALPVDAVLVTHDHPDHVGQALDICKETGATFVGMYELMNKLVEKGLPPDQGLGFNIGGTVTVKGVRIKMVQSVHSSATGVPAGYILTWPDGFCAYHSGDTGLFSDMALFSRFHRIRLAMLPVGGWFTMDAEQAAYACKLLDCELVAPMHWGTFPVLEQNTKSFKEFVAKTAPKTRVLDLTPGKPLTVVE